MPLASPGRSCFEDAETEECLLCFAALLPDGSFHWLCGLESPRFEDLEGGFLGQDESWANEAIGPVISEMAVRCWNASGGMIRLHLDLSAQYR